MNITSHAANLPLATVVNQPTELLRRENNRREIITQVVATNPSVAEKGVASDKERARTPSQTNEQVDFATLRKQAENSASTVTGQGSQQQEGQSEKEQQHTHPSSQYSTENNSSEASENTDADVLVNEQIIRELEQRDQEVRTHELAHASVGGSATGSPSYTFEIGPDGKKYAVEGEVAVDLTTVPDDPQATITKMQKVYAAALAPANPSSQDIQVAASAAQKILAAQTELLAQKKEAMSENNANQDGKISTNLNTAQSNESSDFDALINKTLHSQEVITSEMAHSAKSSQASSSLEPTYNQVQSQEVQQRSQRIESFYFNISQGYEKPDNFQFELTA